MDNELIWKKVWEAASCQKNSGEILVKYLGDFGLSAQARFLSEVDVFLDNTSPYSREHA